MRGYGLTYDTGFFRHTRPETSTRVHFERDDVEREMRIMREDLHCTAVRITGGDADRLATAAEAAASRGLEVWYCPFTCDLSPEQLQEFLVDAADRAERLRANGAEVVLLTGSELSLFTRGFLPGHTLEERLSTLAVPERLRTLLPDVHTSINAFLRRAATALRARFGGKLSYASLPLEAVDWGPFDILATDAAYRSADVADRYRDSIRAFVMQAHAQGKPAAITEFGCCTYRGAAEQGGRGDQIIEWDGFRPARLNGTYSRDETEQAEYLQELLDIYDVEGVDIAFVNTFARYDLPHRADAPMDLDLASYGIVKVLERVQGAAYPDMAWEPKAAFSALRDSARWLPPTPRRTSG